MAGGDDAYMELNGRNAIAIAGKNSRIKGVIGSWIVLTEYDDDYNIIAVKSKQVDGKKIKENTWYTLKNGRFTIVED